MTLTLEITGPQAAKLGAAATKVFRDSGGTIGRLPDNTWSLPDPYVSSRHAAITFRSGSFYIEDRGSRNGVFINSPGNRLAPGQLYELHTGDWILIEPFEIRVSIAGGEPQALADDPFVGIAGLPSPPTPHPNPVFPGAASGPADPFAFDVSAPLPDDGELDPLKALGFAPEPAPPSPPRASDLAAGSVLSDPFVPPPSRPPAPPTAQSGSRSEAGLLPDDWDRPPSVIFPADNPFERPPASPSRPAPPAAKAAPPPQSASAAPASAPLGELGAVLEGAGLGQAVATPEVARDFGRVLRIVVEGLMEVLRARREFKSEFRMGVTTLRPAENNPLKFSANVDDALHNLLVKRNAAYLGTVDAFADAFDDVRNDQMAMLAGMRAAFEAMLQQFDPDVLQQAFDAQARGGLLSTPAKLRYWDQYREKFRDMVRDPEKCFRDLFGDEFSAAYEEHLRQLKSRARR